MTAISPSILEVCAVSKNFGGVAAVQSVDMQLGAGEIVGLIGPNGAGKTTFINLITGMEPLSSGSIRFRGRELAGLGAARTGQLGIARTFQVVKPFRNLSVRENVAVGAMFGAGGAKRNSRQAFARAEEVVTFVGLSELMSRRADQLTVPDLKRLELAKALAMDPQLLLLDEVMAGLNAREIEDAMVLIRKVNAGGVTVLVIEHVMKAIVGLCGRVIVLQFGQKIAEGAPAEVLNNPDVIKAYLGDKYAQRLAARAAAARNET